MSSDSEDDFVTFGTALEPIDEDDVPRKKPFSIEDQVVRDAQGRRRFHGAFTGGFSAGFMNTVGSLEGWKPAEFKSTRADRGLKKEQKPEDYMDAEDLQEFGISHMRLAAKSDYNEVSGAKRKMPNFSDGPIPGVPVLEQILQPSRDTVGVRLLKNMGWRPGQGVGPRVTREPPPSEEKVYGCQPPPGTNEDELDFNWDQLTFAPPDIEPYIVNPKKDSFGLGYSGLDRRSVLDSRSVNSELRLVDKNRKVNIRGQAFGVGAFEEDDEDIYSKDDMSQYDFMMTDEAKKQEGKASSSRHSDLPGFVMAERKVVKRVYPPPTIPSWFKGRHGARRTRFEPCTTSQPVQKAPSGLGRHDVTAQERGVLIGEETPKTNSSIDVPKPVPENQESATKPSSSILHIPVQTTLASASIPTPEIPSSISSSLGFKPFAQDVDKQRRYEQYLALSDKTLLATLQPMSMSSWERDREMREFQQAAIIFKPLTGIMDDRFTRAQQPDDATNPLAVVQRVQHGNSTKRDAAAKKMYGLLTREETDWAPCSLLCKRFNVPEPGTIQPPIDKKKKPKYSIFDSLDDLVKKEPKVEPEQNERQIVDVAVEPVIEPMETITETVPAEGSAQTTSPIFADPKEKIDLFKAIFLDDSDDDESVEESGAIPEQAKFDEPVTNIARNTSPPRGIFANIDLDALSSRKSKNNTDEASSTQTLIPNKLIIEKPLPPPTMAPTVPVQVEEEDPYYGPKLPDFLPNKQPTISHATSSSSSDENEWKEKSKKSKKKSKHSKKHKHKKHKKKHKKSSS